VIEHESELKKSPLHFFVALAKDEVKIREFIFPTVWYKKGQNLIPTAVTPFTLCQPGLPNPCTNIDLLKSLCEAEKECTGLADEIMIMLEEKSEVAVSWIHPKKVRTMRFNVVDMFGIRRPGKVEEVEDNRFDVFRKFLNLEGPCVIRG
jgi:hypothetical protein